MKKFTFVVLGVIAVALVGMFFMVRHNDESEWALVQYPWGSISVKDSSGPYMLAFGRLNTYPDVETIYFSADSREGSKADESFETLFKDKGRANWSCQVTMRMPIAKPDQIEFHRMCKGDFKTARSIVEARLKQAGRVAGEKLTASEAAEKQSAFIATISDIVKSDSTITDELHVKIVDVQITGITFDDETNKQFAEQQEALLLTKKAEVNKAKFEIQTLETESQYKQKIAEKKGEAQMVEIKMVTDAERDKKLALITGSKEVEMAELAKKRIEVEKMKAEIEAAKVASVAKIEAEKLVTVAEINKKAAEIEANKKLEVARINKQAAEEDAEAIKVLAAAEEERITRGGSITEKERVLAEIEARKQANVMAELAKSGRLTPDWIIVGGANGSSDESSTNVNETMLTLKLMESLNMLNSPVVSPK